MANTCTRQLIALTGLSMLTLLGEAFASTSDVIYTVEGSPSCKSFSSNDVKSLSLTGPALHAGSSGTTPIHSPYIEYTISQDGKGIASWSVISGEDTRGPVNFVIVTGAKVSGKQKSTVYHFGSTGSFRDFDVPGPGQALNKVTFCYGLSQGSVGTTQVPSCADLVESGGIDESQVTCPAEGEQRFIFSIDPFAPNGGIQACTCNFEEPLVGCNTATPAGMEGSCLPDSEESGVGLDWVPAEIIIFQNGTGYCYTTSSGTRKCVKK
jgi:hypothetical protein